MATGAVEKGWAMGKGVAWEAEAEVGRWVVGAGEEGRSGAAVEVEVARWEAVGVGVVASGCPAAAVAG